MLVSSIGFPFTSPISFPFSRTAFSRNYKKINLPRSISLMEVIISFTTLNKSINFIPFWSFQSSFNTYFTEKTLNSIWFYLLFFWGRYNNPTLLPDEVRAPLRGILWKADFHTWNDQEWTYSVYL